jgi:hypothetical protein
MFLRTLHSHWWDSVVVTNWRSDLWAPEPLFRREL